MAEFVAIMNPAAGGGRCGKQAGAALTRLRDAGIAVDVLETRAPGDATRLAREAYEAGKRHFIAVGGDGTSYEIVNGLFPLPAGNGGPTDAERPTLGFSLVRAVSDAAAARSVEPPSI